MRQLNRKNLRYLFRREFIVALANCIVFSLAIYLITSFWFNDYSLSLAISVAMIFNLLAAAIFGDPMAVKFVGLTSAVRFTALGAGEVKFFGQVLQKATLVEYEIDIKRIRKQSLVVGFADGSMKVDGKEIYTAKNLKVGLFKDPSGF